MFANIVWRMINATPEHVKYQMLQNINYIILLFFFECASNLKDKLCRVNYYHAQESKYKLKEPHTGSQLNLECINNLFIVSPVESHFDFSQLLCYSLIVFIPIGKIFLFTFPIRIESRRDHLT